MSSNRHQRLWYSNHCYYLNDVTRMCECKCISCEYGFTGKLEGKGCMCDCNSTNLEIVVNVKLIINTLTDFITLTTKSFVLFVSFSLFLGCLLSKKFRKRQKWMVAFLFQEIDEGDCPQKVPKRKRMVKSPKTRFFEKKLRTYKNSQ